MRAELIRASIVSLKVHPTHSMLDQSLAAIEHFLSQRFAEWERNAQTRLRAPVSIDIGFLGLSDDASGACESWKENIVYPIRVHFSTVLLGPIYNAIRAGGPCPRCLEQRWLSNHCKAQEYSAYQNRQRVLAGPHQKLHPAALEALRDIIEADLRATFPAAPVEDGRAWFHALSLDSLQVQRYQLIADSSCPICAESQPPLSCVEAFRLETRQKRGISTYRLVDPLAYPFSETGYLDSVSGVLGNLLHIGLHHTVTASAMGSYYLQGKAVSWGGNTTKFRTSQRCGMLEGLERYCGLLWPRTGESTITDSYQNVQADALDPSTCGLYHPDTYQFYSEQLEPFMPESKINWVWGYSFRRACPILVPEQLAYYARRTEKGRSFVFDTSNGCAIGSCLEEAILHGLF